jgi:hypothetical protein
MRGFLVEIPINFTIAQFEQKMKEVSKLIFLNEDQYFSYSGDHNDFITNILEVANCYEKKGFYVRRITY